MRYCSLHALTRKRFLRGRRLVGEQYGIPRETHMHEVHFHIASPPFVRIHIPYIQRLQYALCLVHAHFTRYFGSCQVCIGIPMVELKC